MRKKVRGLRVIEQAVLARQKARDQDDLTPETPEATGPATLAGADPSAAPWLSRRAPWCSTIARRCVAFSMTIKEGRCTLPACGWPRPWVKSRSRSNGTWTRKKGVRGGATRPALGMHQGGLDEVKEQQEVIRDYVEVIAEVAATLEPGTEDITEREEKFEALIDQFEQTDDPIRHGMARVMLSFLAGPLRGRGGV